MMKLIYFFRSSDPPLSYLILYIVYLSKSTERLNCGFQIILLVDLCLENKDINRNFSIDDVGGEVQRFRSGRIEIISTGARTSQV